MGLPTIRLDSRFLQHYKGCGVIQLDRNYYGFAGGVQSRYFGRGDRDQNRDYVAIIQ
jgi:hypothetical protein